MAGLNTGPGAWGQWILRTVISQISKILRESGRVGDLQSGQLLIWLNDRLTKTKHKNPSIF